jgi:hypothetical protein
MSEQSKEIVPYREPAPIPLGEMERMAVAIAKSGLFGMRTPEQALTLMLISQAEGRHPALAARDYDIIQGRPSKKAEAMFRDFLASGGKVDWHALDDAQADATFSHPAGGSVRITWDMNRAKLAGVAEKDNWKKYPRQMLRSRTVSEGVRSVYPAATSGVYAPEEVQDFDDKKPLEAKDASDAKPSVVTSEVTGVTAAASESDTPRELPPRTGPTEKQLKRLFAISKKAGWQPTAVKAYMRAHFNKEASADLTWKEYELLCQEIERTPIVEPEPMAGEFAPLPEDERPFES